MNLWSSFSPTSNDQWREKIQKDLKGNTIDSINWETPYGTIDPTSEVSNKLYLNEPAKLNELSWKFDSNNCDNKNILSHLKNGINAINIYNQPLNDSLFDNVMNEIIFNNIHLNNTVSSNEISNWLNWMNINMNANGSLRTDPIGEAIEKSLLANEKINANIIKIINSKLVNKKYNCIYVNGEKYGNLFSDQSTELTYLIAHLNETIELYKSLDIPIPTKLVIKTSISADFIQETSKLRALRALVIQIFEIHKLDINIQIECSYKESLLSPIDQENNILRITTAFISAIVSGVNSIELYDSLCIKKGDYWKKMITNVPIILIEESQLNVQQDVIDGSHVIEQASYKMAHHSWSLFKEIEEMGGLISHAQKGKLNETVLSQQSEKLNDLKNNERKVIGFNFFNENINEIDFTKSNNIPFKLKDFI